MSLDTIRLARSSGLLAALGVSVTYTPAGGVATGLTVLVDKGVSFGDMDALKAEIKIRKTDIAFTPAAEDKVLINGVEFKVHDGPGARIDNSDAVFWVLPVIGEERANYKQRRRM